MFFKQLPITLSVVFLSLGSAQSMNNGVQPRDPLERINYTRAFNLERVYEKHRGLLEDLGCADNVFEPSQTLGQGQETAVRISLTEKQRAVALKSFVDDCLRHLKSYRRNTLLEPAREAVTLMGLMSVMMGLLVETAGSASFGGSFGMFACMFDSIWFIRDVIRSGWNLYDTPPHTLDRLEIRYAIDQCFLPKDIWSIVTENFIRARTNQFESRKSEEFIKFALGLTVFAPQPTCDLSYGDAVAKADTLVTKIRSFFDSYEPFEIPHELDALCSNLRRFAMALMNHPYGSIRYIYLVGPGGIGKTHLANLIAEWVKDELPVGVHFEEANITTHIELEGDAAVPGLYLKVLRNQCLKRRSVGSVVFIDEANWLNDEDFNGPAKRVFNETPNHISTKYFGAGIDGSGIKVKIGPTLSLAAGNNPIIDQNLASRFDVIHFPNPKAEVLISFGIHLAEINALASRVPGMLTTDQKLSTHFKSYIEAKIKEIKNFRALKALVPALVEGLHLDPSKAMKSD